MRVTRLVCVLAFVGISACLDGSLNITGVSPDVGTVTDSAGDQSRSDAAIMPDTTPTDNHLPGDATPTDAIPDAAKDSDTDQSGDLDILDATEVPTDLCCVGDSDTQDHETVCVPQCEINECGPDGCGGTCWVGGGEECEDGNACNGVESCQQGLCTTGVPLECQDQNPCTMDYCEPDTGCQFEEVADGATEGCADGNPCTYDRCEAGVCISTLKALDEIVPDECHCTTDEDCLPLENEDACDGILHCDLSLAVPTCSILPGSVSSCDDGKWCNGLETCNSDDGSCKPGLAPVLDDNVLCTVDTCDEAKDEVVHAPDNSLCDDHNACTGTETCDASVGCQIGTPVVCDDGKWCNGLETCNPDDGSCKPGLSPVFDDNVLCTVDTCDEAKDEVVHTPDNSLCDDHHACTGTETCNASLGCQIGTPVVCDDGKWCNGMETCNPADGSCKPGLAPVLDDNVPCTVDTCDEAKDEVVHAPDNSLCDDHNACTGTETCNALLGCQIGTPVDCSDGKWCNGMETCNPADGSCKPGLAPVLDDNVPCTADTCDEAKDEVVHVADNGACELPNVCYDYACDPAFGCTQIPNTTTCDDGEACTIDDTCLGGACAGTPRLWAMPRGGTGSDLFADVLALDDGGFLFAGTTWSASLGAKGGDGWLLRTNAAGEELWSYPYGGTSADGLYAVAAAEDGGFVAVGNSMSAVSGNTGLWVLKVDENGGVVWSKAFGSTQGDFANAVLSLKGGGFAVAGYHGYVPNQDNWDSRLLLLDNDGNPLVDKSYGGSGVQSIIDLAQTDDGGFIAAGDASGASKYDGWLLRLDKEGNELWRRTFGGSGDEIFYGVVELPEGEFVAAGHSKTNTPNGADDLWMVWVDPQGNQVRERYFGTTGADQARSLELAPDGGLVMAGFSPLGSGWVLRTDVMGNKQWEVKKAGRQFAHATFSKTGGVVAAGETSGGGDGWTQHMDAWGHETCGDAGVCGGMTLVDCADGSECTQESCDPIQGCITQVLTDFTACNDHDPCSASSTCAAGECVGSVDPACADSDDDEVCPYSFCETQAADTCPFVWNPDNNPQACGSLPALPYQRGLALSQPASPKGSSTWRRTREPLEVPLANGLMDDSVVLYLPLDGNVEDSGPYGLAVANNGAEATEGAFGNANSAVSLDGVQDRIYPNLTSRCSGTNGPFTTQLWFRSDSYRTAYLVNNAAPCGGVSINLRADGHVGIAACGTASCSVHVEPDCGLYSLNQWHHVAVVWDGNVIRCHLDAQLSGSAIITSVVSDTAGPVWVGGNPAPSYSYSFQGSVDDLVMFTRALSPTEIQTYYRSRYPWGTSFLPDSQIDFDDLRVSETVGLPDPGHLIPHEVTGPRPHSDSICSLPLDDGTWSTREDLCSVVGYWKLDGDGLDFGPAGHNGVLSNAASGRGRFGETGGAVVFNGVDSTMDVPSLSDYRPANNLTLEAWVKPDRRGADASFVAGYMEFGGYAILVDPDGRPRFSFADESGTYKDLYSPAAIPLDSWTHLAATCEGSKATLYVNGILAGETTLNGGLKYSSHVPFSIGSNPNLDGLLHDQQFAGKIDEVILHSVAKSPEYLHRRTTPSVPTVRILVSTNMSANPLGAYDWNNYVLHWGDSQLSVSPPVISGLPTSGLSHCYGLLSPCLGYAGWWRFNEGFGPSALDSSTYKNHGRLKGDTSWALGGEGFAVGFDGSGDFVEMSHGQQYTTPMGTLEALFRPTQDVSGSLPAAMAVASKEGGLYVDDWYWYLDPSNGKLRFRIDSSSSGASLVDTDSGNWSKERFYASAVTFGPTGMAAYVDHLEQLSTHSNATGIGGTAALLVGAIWNGSYFSGVIDSFRIMRRALRQDETLHYPMADWAYPRTP